MKARIILAALEDVPEEVEPVELESVSIGDALDETLKRFQYSVDGGWGDLAKKHKTRSLGVGDVIVLEDPEWPGERFFRVAEKGFKESRKAAVIAFQAAL